MGGWKTPESPAAITASRELLTVLTTLCAVIWLAVFPLLTGFTYTRITEDKALIALVLLAVTAVILGTGLWLTRGVQRRMALPEWLLLGYGVWLILSALFGAHADVRNARGLPAVWMGMLRFEGVLTQLGYVCLFLLFSRGSISLKPLLNACGAAQLLFLLVVVLQYAGQNPLTLFPTGKSVLTNYEFQGTLGNIDMISGYLCLMIPLTLGGYIAGAAGGLSLLGGMAGLLLQACMEVQGGLLALTFSAGLLCFGMMWLPTLRQRGLQVLGLGALVFGVRQLVGFPWLDGTETLSFPQPMIPLTLSLLILGAGLLLLSLIPRQKLERKTLTFRQSCLAMAVLLALSATVFLLLPLTPASLGLYEIQETLKGRGQDHFGSYRLGVWRYALTLANQHPVFGGGSDTFYTALSQHLTQLGVVLPESFDNAHNEFVTMAANNGYPALLLYLAGIGTLLCLGRPSPEKRILTAAVMVYLVQSFFCFSVVIVAPMFWVTAGLCAAAGRRDPTSSKEFATCNQLSP